MALGYSVVALALDFTYISEEVHVCVCVSMYVHRWLGWHRRGHFQMDTDAAFPIKVKIEGNRGHWLLQAGLLSASVCFTKPLCVFV